ncbi:MAG TPA: HAMP domain-containing histidine kinase [Candidatus Anaerobutyricum avicola]|nr:HAMP domain-containing histidine kinase [Candidatus Anaerobutyricum avicola]
MNLRKKIALASILMILIPIVVACFFSVVVLFFHGSGTLNRLEALYNNDNGLLNVQTILYNYQNQILTYQPVEEVYNPSGYTDEDDEWDDDEWDDDDWDEDEDDEGQSGSVDSEALLEEEIRRQNNAFGTVIRELSNIGYYYEIYYGDQLIASNLPEGSEEKIAAIAGTEYKNLASFAVTDGSSSAVKRSYAAENTTLSILAFCEDYVSNSSDSQVIRDFISILGIFVGALAVAIAISIFILTRWLSGGMNKSLEQLSEGVRQVQDGNFSYRIRSKKKDELGKACQEFDEMIEYLDNSVKEREKYEEAKQQLLAGISHDLRTPLTSIKAYVEGLRDGIANTEEKKRRYYDAIKIRTEDLADLIDNLSLFSRFDRGEYHYSMERIDFGEFVDSFFKEHGIEFKNNGLSLVKTVWEKNNLFIQGDRQQLKRILGNLINNTIKYREKPKSVVTAALYTVDEKWIRLELSDDGPGVPEEERDKIFDTFYRGDKARRNPGNGSGLGLSIVREIMKGHGGRIWAEEGIGGKGLKFVMEFPVDGEEAIPEMETA